MIFQDTVENKSVFTVAMKVKQSPIVDNLSKANPQEYDQKAILGVRVISSQLLCEKRKYFEKIFQFSPYCEVLYSFDTTAGEYDVLSLSSMYSLFPPSDSGYDYNLLFTRQVVRCHWNSYWYRNMPFQWHMSLLNYFFKSENLSLRRLPKNLNPKTMNLALNNNFTQTEALRPLICRKSML
jgi:hypothetical protein